MTKKLILLIYTIIFVFLFDCSNNFTGNQDDTFPYDAYNHIVQLQKDCYNCLADLLNINDTSDALDSIIRILLKDETVEWSEKVEDGIAIQYKCGILGGIIFTVPESENRILSIEHSVEETTNILQNESHSGVALPSKNAILISIDGNIDEAFNSLSKVGIFGGQLKKKHDAEANLELFASLSSFGIISIYTHALKWPKGRKEIYIRTGETVNDATSLNPKFSKLIESGEIPLIVLDRRPYYYISPNFISNFNNFKKSNTLFLANYCSSLNAGGNWEDKIINEAQACSMVGYDKTLHTNQIVNWMKSIIDSLTDTSRFIPKTLIGWFYDTYPLKWFEDPKYGKIYILNKHNGDIVLWEKEKTELEGIWEGHEYNGDDGWIFSVKFDNATIYSPDGKEYYKGKIKLDTTVVPKKLDCFITECISFENYVGKTALTIYKIYGDSLMWAGSEPGETYYPSTFFDPRARLYYMEKKFKQPIDAK